MFFKSEKAVGENRSVDKDSCPSEPRTIGSREDEYLAKSLRPRSSRYFSTTGAVLRQDISAVGKKKEKEGGYARFIVVDQLAMLRSKVLQLHANKAGLLQLHGDTESLYTAYWCLATSEVLIAT